MNERGHHGIRQSIRRRITDGEWAPGTMIPGEVELANEYSCARATVNRALRALAEDGLIERKRRAGTRVREVPIRKAKLEIPIIRAEIEAAGMEYRPHLLTKERGVAPDFIAARLKLGRNQKALHLETAHLADGRAYAYEDRWINIEAAPEVLSAPLNEISANEWLIRKIPYSNGNVEFSAVNANAHIAQILNIVEGASLFTIDRVTWRQDQFITSVKIYYPPGYKLRSEL